MKSEEFIEIHLPNSLANENGGYLVLSKIKESLALFEFIFVDEKRVCDVWMMKKDVEMSF